MNGEITIPFQAPTIEVPMPPPLVMPAPSATQSQPTTSPTGQPTAQPTKQVEGAAQPAEGAAPVYPSAGIQFTFPAPGVLFGGRVLVPIFPFIPILPLFIVP